MNIVSYNLVKFQYDNKLSNKKMANLLQIDNKKYLKMKRESYKYNNEEISLIANKLLISKDELKTKMFEHINLKEKKIYGTDYLNVNYEVILYKIHNINLISAIVDILFLIILAILLITKQVLLSLEYSSFMNLLKTIFIIELLVFPFMFIVLPLLKIYFNRTYVAVLKSQIQPYYQEEACGIIHSCLRRSINKSIIPYIFTIFSELNIALYCFIHLINIKQIELGYLLMIVLFIISLIIFIYSLKYHIGKEKNVVKKGDESNAKESISN